MAFVDIAARTVHCAGGCANVKLYDEVRDKHGQEAAKAWKEVDLDKYFAARKEERQSTLGLELQVADKRIQMGRSLRHL